jgi:hypothetical protein
MEINIFTLAVLHAKVSCFWAIKKKIYFYKVCGRSLADIGFYVNPDGAYVCSEHVQRSGTETPKKEQKESKRMGLFKRSSSRDSRDISQPLSIESNAHRNSFAPSQGSPTGATSWLYF